MPLFELRHYRLLSRRPFLDVNRDQVSVRLPGLFGGNTYWSIPTSEVAVQLPGEAGVDDDGNDWVFQRPLLIPYAATTTNNVRPNLMLYFTRPQRIPPLRYVGAKNVGLSYRQSRSPDGLSVDGVQFRAVDPDEAVRALIGLGAEPVSRPNAWLRAHHPTTSDPTQVAAVAASRTRWRWAVKIAFAAFVSVQVVRFLLHGRTPTWLFGLLVLALLAVFGLPAWAGWRDRRSGVGPGSRAPDPPAGQRAKAGP